MVIDLEGKHIYPSFVETYSSFGVKTPERSFGGRSPQYEATRAGYYWNDHVRAETNALNEFEYDNKAEEVVANINDGRFADPAAAREVYNSMDAAEREEFLATILLKMGKQSGA